MASLADKIHKVKWNPEEITKFLLKKWLSQENPCDPKWFDYMCVYEDITFWRCQQSIKNQWKEIEFEEFKKIF